MASPQTEAPFSVPATPGYTLTEQLYSSAKTAVYRAVETETQRPVVIKRLQPASPGFHELVKFRNQYAIAQNLPIPGIVRSLSLKEWPDGYALVMEDFGGLSLAKYVKAHPLNLIETLAIGVQMAEILHDLIQHRLIHKDIKPANIIIHPDSGRIKLTDFSISSLLPKETQQLQTANELAQTLEGTLSYLAPEQTGRMNRGVDYRADFYALGVTLYELLMGELPFPLNDPLALVHAHIAKQPVPPHQVRSHIPLPISAIVLKLMAKNAEDRYQSALGLKYDLEKCLHELKEKNTVVEFELAQRDVCDRFLIPEKLYGREAEVKILLEAFDRIAIPQAVPSEDPLTHPAEIVLVAGSSGIGKTAIIKEVHKPITQQKGYFIRGKFDQFNRNTPFSAFVSAFRGLITQLSGETDAALASWKSNILEAVGDHAQVIIDVIPELETILGPQPNIAELSGVAAQARFNQVLGKFVRVFARREHPLVIFLDDLQWADAASLMLLNVLITETQAESLLVLGAYRDNEVFAGHPFMLTLDELADQGIPVHTLTLHPLPEEDVTRLVADTLHCLAPVAQPLANLVYEKTKGNPFFTTQFLEELQEEGCIVFDASLGQWQCDLVQVQQLAATDDVVSFMVSRLQKLPAETQSVLKLAACLGNQFDLYTLAVVCQEELSTLSADLWMGLQEGFILPEGETYKFFQGDRTSEDGSTAIKSSETSAEAIAANYRFLHDRVQQAAYVSIPEDQRPATHYMIGQRLLKQLAGTGLELAQHDNLFEIVNHLNFGKDFIKVATERAELAELNLAAGKKALDATACEAAADYLSTGIALLEKANTAEMWVEHYELSFNLYSMLCSAQLNSAAYEQLTATIETAIQHISNPIDLAEIYVIRVVQLTLSGHYQEAVQSGLSGLQKLGVETPLDNLSEGVKSEFSAITELLENRSVRSLLDLSKTAAPETQATIKLLIAIDPAAYISGKIELYSFVSLRAVNLSVTHGNIPESIKAYVNYGLLLGLMKGDYQRGYEFADLAVQLSYRLDSKSQRCKAGLLLGGWIRAWAKPIAGAAEINYQGFLAGMEAGESQFAAYNLFSNIFNRIFQGENLNAIAKDIEKYGTIADKIKDELLWVALAGANIFTHKLCCDRAEQSAELITSAEKTIQQGETAQTWFSVCLYYILKMHVACLTADFEAGLRYEIAAGKALDAASGFTTCSDYYYYGSLILLNHYADSSQPERTAALQKVQANQAQLKIWSKSCPENFLHKFLLVEAERCRIQGKRLAAIDLYDRAIDSAKENGFVQSEAIANELAARFYLQWGKEKFAEGYLQAAYRSYARWGARAKVVQLEQDYPALLAAVLPAECSSMTVADPTAPRSSLTVERTHQLTHAVSTSQQTNLWLDLPVVMQAAQTISQEIELEKLLDTLMHVAITSAGAQSGHLLLRAGDKKLGTTWVVAVQAVQDQTRTLNSPLSQYSGVPRSLVYAVARTGETAVFENLSTDEQFGGDAYAIAHQPKSVLCLPVNRQGELIGMLYLENSLAEGAFTRDRTELLQLLASQAAISIENARLYQQIEGYSQTLEVEVARKTDALNQKAQDLEQALATIRKTQAQLIQTEKMSSLGQMVAGIAHEINNPINFIQGNIIHVQEYIEDILTLLALYQQASPHPSAAIQTKEEELDIDFLVKDIDQLLNSMTSGSDRICNIVLSLRNFSRLDESAKKTVDLHSGIESTLLIVQNRLQATDNQAAIQLTKSYGDLPKINCYPSQLNQVFLHLINNAIDAVREPTQSGHSPEIQITTGVTEQGEIRIAIANNGSPIPPEIQARIFDPFFTTKAVGKGTGLGLFVSYSTIQKHHGKLTVKSAMGEGTASHLSTEFEILLPLNPL